MTGALVPLPYVLASLAFAAHSQTSAPDTPSDSAFDRLRASVAEEEPPSDIVQPGQHSPVLEACILASGTLLFTALLAKLGPNAQALDRRKAKFGDRGDSKAALRRVQQMATSALSVGLPFYAAAQLGGVRVGVVMLAAIACGVCGTNAALRPVLAIRRMAQEKKLLCAYLGFGLICDMLGFLASSSAWQVLTGYLALAVSIFVVPPPLPIKIHTTPPPAQPTGIKGGLSPLIESPDKAPVIHRSISITTSPLVLSKDDVTTTFVSGAVLSIFTVIISSVFQSAPSFTTSTTFFALLSVVSASCFYILARPSTLQSSYKSGVAAGCVSTAAAGLLLHSDSWLSASADILFSGLAFFTVSREAGSASASHHHGHDHDHKSHHHQPHGPHAHDKHSSFTGLLLKNVEAGGLIHSILVEKDSRRIAYFGWSVPSFSVILSTWDFPLTQNIA